MESKELKVKKGDVVTVEFNGKSAYHKAGDQAIVHSLQAAKLVKKGVAKIVK